jgi:hypothetical protein
MSHQIVMVALMKVRYINRSVFEGFCVEKTWPSQVIRGIIRAFRLGQIALFANLDF